MNTRQKVLEDALKCVNGEREKQYGNPEDNFRRIAKRWSLYLTELYEDEGVVIELDPIDVARMMIEFKLARANGPKDKLDNYIDMIGYSACAAEIFENGNEDKTDEYSKDPYSYFHNSLVKYASTKAKEKNIPLEIDKLKEYNRNFPRELADYLHDAVDDCVMNGKRLLDCYKELDEMFAKYKPEINDVQVADECKECDYAEKCIGTGVCLKDTEKKCLKDKPDYKCNRKDCGQFDACMAAYQHYVCNKTKEASEAIDKCMCENSCDEKANAFDHYYTNVLLDKKDPYSYAHNKLANYVSIKANEEHIQLEKLKDVDHKFPKELFEYLDQAATDCIVNGKRFLDCYKEIDELFGKYMKEGTPKASVNREDSICRVNETIYEISRIIETSKHLKGYGYDHVNLDDDKLTVVWKKQKEDKNKYGSFWQSYNNISAHIALESSKANVNPVDVVNHLTRNPTEMASLLANGELDFDDVAAYVNDAINEVKKETNEHDS